MVWPTWLLEHGRYHFVALSCRGPGIIVHRFLGLGCQTREHTDFGGYVYYGRELGYGPLAAIVDTFFGGHIISV